MTTSSLAIDVHGLKKSYDDNEVLSGVDLSVAEGSVHALLGPNGAGKTTLVNILSTLLRPDAGTIAVAGHDVLTEQSAVRRSIGVTGQFSAIDELLTGRENLQMMADLGHLGQADAAATVNNLLARFDLTDAADRRASTYSGGMKRRLDLAMTLVGRPRLVFLDEPTTGLDPRSRRELWQIVREQVAGGVTVLLTTQYLDEADHMADRVSVIDGGTIVAEGAPAELKRRVPGGHVRVRAVDERAYEALTAAHPDADADADALTVRIANDGSLPSLRAVLQRLDDADVAEVTVHSPALDDVFLALTGHTVEPVESRKELAK